MNGCNCLSWKPTKGDNHNPQGKRFDYQPEFLKDKLSNSGEWREFVEMCFDPKSPINNKLKEMLTHLSPKKLAKNIFHKRLFTNP